MATHRLILHVGPHKTGSTYLQFRLSAAREALAALGWSYPLLGIDLYGHHGIQKFLAGRKDIVGVDAETLRQALTAGPNVILSSEDFSYLNRPQLLDLKALLVGVEIEFVIYVRTAVNLWPSHWQQLVRAGRTDTFADYLNAMSGWSKPGLLAAHDPGRLATRLAGVFGPECLRFVCYDNLLETGEDLFEHFWARVLLLQPPAAKGDQTYINQSEPESHIDLLRNLNERFEGRTGRSAGMAVHAFYRQVMTELTAPADKTYTDAFLKNAATYTLRSDSELIRVRERMLLNRWGAQIINKASPEKLFIRDVFERTVRAAPRYWAVRAGLARLLDTILDPVIAQETAKAPAPASQ